MYVSKFLFVVLLGVQTIQGQSPTVCIIRNLLSCASHLGFDKFTNLAERAGINKDFDFIGEYLSHDDMNIFHVTLIKYFFLCSLNFSFYMYNVIYFIRFATLCIKIVFVKVAVAVIFIFFFLLLFFFC